MVLKLKVMFLEVYIYLYLYIYVVLYNIYMGIIFILFMFDVVSMNEN